jgi:4-amino-4-deoxychorismate lyase
MSQFFQGNKQVYFETIYCNKGKAFHLEYHEKRIYRTIQKKFDLKKSITPPNSALYRCKMIYNHDKIEEITYSLYKKKEIKKLKIIHSNTIEYSCKYLDRSQINMLYEKKEDCDEIIIMQNGYITDTSIANIAILKDNQWLTPQTPLLYGTTRARLLDEKKIKEKQLTLEDLLLSKKIALFNAMVGFNVLQNYEIIL